MTETEIRLEALRHALGDKTNARGHRMFSIEATQLAVGYARPRIESGVQPADVAAELGLKEWTLRRWLERTKEPISSGREARTFVKLEVKAKATAKMVVHGPCGLRVEGLSIREVAELFRSLECLV